MYESLQISVGGVPLSQTGRRKSYSQGKSKTKVSKPLGVVRVYTGDIQKGELRDKGNKKNQKTTERGMIVLV